MKVLLVYEEVPETTKLYTLPETTKLYILDVTDEDWQWMRFTAGRYVNGSENSDDEGAALEKLSNYLVDKHSIETTSPVVPGVTIDAVLVTGFLL